MRAKYTNESEVLAQLTDPPEEVKLELQLLPVTLDVHEQHRINTREADRYARERALGDRFDSVAAFAVRTIDYLH